MEKIKLKVNAKINLNLGINGVFEDGYHILDMLLTSIDVYDVVTISKSIVNEVYMDNKIQDPSNTAVKAVELLEQAYGYKVKVEIEKHIPYKAGLGGSSADAAAVFFAYSKLYEIDPEYMTKLAQSVGSDVIYMMQGGLAKVKCRGDIVQPLIDKLSWHIVVAQKSFGASTQEVYQEYDKCEQEPNKIDVNGVSIFNVLEKPALSLTPEIEAAKKDLLTYTDKVFMTGSGSAFIGVFDSAKEAKKCASSLKNYEYVKAMRTLDRGIEIIEE